MEINKKVELLEAIVRELGDVVMAIVLDLRSTSVTRRSPGLKDLRELLAQLDADRKDANR